MTFIDYAEIRVTPVGALGDDLGGVEATFFTAHPLGCEVCSCPSAFRLLRVRLIMGLRNLQWACADHVEAVHVAMVVEGSVR